MPLWLPVSSLTTFLRYLTYIIHNYNHLSDVTIFLHGHQFAWHNEYVFGYDSARMVQNLSLEHVLRVGYANLRCTLEPGCPEHLHPTSPTNMTTIPEEAFWAGAWRELFPSRDVPAIVSQPCCAQFAVSKSRIQSYSFLDYLHFRDWLIHTELEDQISGRVWEYMWHILFWLEDEYCPEPSTCWCDVYNACSKSELNILQDG